MNRSGKDVGVTFDHGLGCRQLAAGYEVGERGGIWGSSAVAKAKAEKRRKEWHSERAAGSIL